ncbi:hypothetical protein QL285_092343 [Trifolium repens]|nr:hypothetical protein QL285_092343 [Trifolium repens]
MEGAGFWLPSFRKSCQNTPIHKPAAICFLKLDNNERSVGPPPYPPGGASAGGFCRPRVVGGFLLRGCRCRLGGDECCSSSSECSCSYTSSSSTSSCSSNCSSSSSICLSSPAGSGLGSE